MNEGTLPPRVGCRREVVGIGRLGDWVGSLDGYFVLGAALGHVLGWVITLVTSVDG